MICALLVEVLDDLESSCVYFGEESNIRIEITTSWQKFAFLSEIPDSRVKIRTNAFNFRRIGVLVGNPPSEPQMSSQDIDEFASI